jgi:hypothetical protein
MSDAKCPYCQAEKYDNSITQTDMAGNPFPFEDLFLCGSSLNFQPELCREREMHNQTKRERDEYYARAASLVLHLPPETIAGKVQQWRDEFKADRENLLHGRDEAIEALCKIEEIFIDGDDTYEDWKSMGQIARTFLEKTHESRIDKNN